MKELYRRQVIWMREKANFFRITQSDHQSRKQFANRLREAAGHCNFESFNTEAALVLQFISGMEDEEINVRLLAKSYHARVSRNQRNKDFKAQRRFEWRSFTVHEMNLNGETMVTVEGDTGMRKPVLRLAKIRATNIMGLDCINAFRAKVFEDGIGHCTKVKAHDEQKDGFVPVFRKPFPLAFAIHDAVGKELERYADMGVLTPTDSSVWAALIVTVKKLRGKIGICADFSAGLNDRIMVDSYPIPRAEVLYQALRFGKTFTKLDLTKAYLQVELDEESKKILVINTHNVLYHYIETAFWCAFGSSDFPKGYGYNEFGLPIRMEKCVFFEKEVRYQGHIFSSKGIRGDPKKTAAIVNMPLPTIISKLRKDARWNWTGEHAKAVERIKRLLNSSFLLTHYQPAWPIALAANASNEGIGAVVNHRLRDGTVKVIAHVSKMHNAAQSNYGQIEKQALAHVYRVNSKKGVPQMAACRLTRWAIALMSYSFDIEYCSTKNFCQADLKQLTAEFQAELPVTARAIAEATKKYSLLKEELRSYFIKRTELSKSYGCLLWEIRTVIPMKLQSRVLMILHETHPGRERMLSMVRKFCWWTAMNKDIEIKAQSCEGCATAQKNSAKVAINPWQLSDRPWKRIHADFAEPIIGKMYLIVVHAHLKWPEVLHMLHNGTQFTATEFTIFCEENGIHHVTSATYIAQSNGQVKRYIHTFKRAIKKSTNDRHPKKDRLREYLMTYRITSHPSTKLTPSEIFLERRIRTVFDLMFSKGIKNHKEQKKNGEQFTEL
ncbi:Uncharacterized protein T4E_10808 [Trichinella pseudospiralis]|uniref:RNA-directed DNA polymerase n=1 Tax=Trichinella pseudospiralis TaxID=6337 RepID=A0A0V0XEQ6_TRIPS|nr:Uncharacterized protein T4E_10808 [Trichinella pseudospiralis]